MSEDRISRRAFVAAAASATLLGCGDDKADVAPPPASSTRTVDPPPPPPRSGVDASAPPPSSDAATPACIETAKNIEGPFYTPGAPARTTLITASVTGTKLTIRGQVRSTKAACGALGGAVLDVWQADANGAYDNAGFTLRGKITADAEGRFVIETIIPGRYLDGAEYRPMHIHVKVSAPGHALLTTQLYFEGDPYNATDEYFLAPLAMKTKDEPGGEKSASFDFVLPPAA